MSYMNHIIDNLTLICNLFLFETSSPLIQQLPLPRGVALRKMLAFCIIILIIRASSCVNLFRC